MDGIIKIAYAEDHALIRKCIVDYITSFEGCSVIIEAKNGLELITAMEEAAFPPDLCILDIFMPVMNGLEALIKIKQRWPNMRALVLTGHSTEYYGPKMLQAGAGAFLLKEDDPEFLREAIYSVHEHGVYSPDLDSYKFLLSAITKKSRPPELTDAEIAVLKYCCSDLSYAQIAHKMNITMHSVDWHRNSLFKKLNVRSRSSLVLYAVQFGLVELSIDETGKSVIRHRPAAE